MIVRFPLILAAMLAATPALAAAPVTGRWLTANKDSVVEVAPCGAQLCGRIVKLLKPVQGGPATDRNNPDAALRTRPLLGLPILSGFTDKGSSWGGTIYDPRNGRSYRSTLTLGTGGVLKVQGCIAFLCQTQEWSAAPKV